MQGHSLFYGKNINPWTVEPCPVELESFPSQGQRVFADKLCRDVDKNLVESPGANKGIGQGWMVLMSFNEPKLVTDTPNGKG